MNIRFVLSMLVLTAVVLLGLFLSRQNTIASGGNTQQTYLSLNRSDADNADRIIQTWRQDNKKVAAIKTIVVADCFLIAIYSLYLCISLYQEARKDQKRWLKNYLQIGIFLILLGAVTDVIQDHKIYNCVSGNGGVPDLRWYTYIKWTALFLGVVPLLISIFPKDFSLKKALTIALRDLSSLLKSIWTFFPALLFIFLAIFCFWLLGQGKDIIIAFTEKYSTAIIPRRIIFFIAIGFWVYVVWYSSRIISYIKEKKQAYQGSNFLDIATSFLDEFPRLTGNACFLVLELAMWQVPILNHPISSSEAAVIFVLALFNLHFIDRWISQRWSHNKTFTQFFWVLSGIFLVLLLIVARIKLSPTQYIVYIFGLLVIFHVIFIVYINLRRADLTRKAAALALRPEKKPAKPTFMEKTMDFLYIPRVEAGYFKWFLGVSVLGLVAYLGAICCLTFARGVGPLPFIILAFAVILFITSIFTSLSVRYRVNFHLIIFLMAFLLSKRENHYVRTFPVGKSNEYMHRPPLKDYLKAWLNERIPDPANLKAPYDIYFVLADGGASRSGYWTSSVLGRLEDSTPGPDSSSRFSSHVFCLSGTSGGGVGVATYYSLLSNKVRDSTKCYEQSAKDFLRQDYLSFTLSRMLGPDYFGYIFHFRYPDRAAALEESFETSSGDMDTTKDYRIHFQDDFSTFHPIDENKRAVLPILFINTTRMQDGTPGVVTNIDLDSTIFNSRVNVLDLLDTTRDITMASGAILGARFPYLSPAGRIANEYFVDGGYFDNSGAGAVQELIRGIFNTAADDLSNDSLLLRQVRKLHFHILHIENSPIDLDSSNFKKVAPIKNDLFSPLLTIVGAYDMQTTVNDRRLYNYISDINKYQKIPAEDTVISLYESHKEWLKDPLRDRFDAEPPYAMNWFMSDTTRSRIDKRLESQPVLNFLIGQMTKK